jgi:EAL domain-containing protein (putative c-di-GMP-specific phosphodiesterase class I)
MSFITRAQLNSYNQGFTVANEYVRARQVEATALNSWQVDVSIFLSHSHKDKDLILPAIAFLRSHGVKVYVDSLLSKLAF